MKKLILFSVIFALNTTASFAMKYEVRSPDGKIRVKINAAKELSYAVFYLDTELISPSSISLHTEKNGVFGINAKVKNVKQTSVDRMLTPIVKQKSAGIREEYNEMELEFKNHSSVTFRVFNNGVAYRWESRIKEEIIVVSEEANFIFSADHTVWFPEEESLFSHQEREYLQETLSAITYDRFCSTPALVDVDGIKLVISEADLRDYPGMYLRGDSEAYSLKGKFPRVVVDEEQTSDRDVRPLNRADHIAKTHGERTFPWRVIAIAEHDGDLITNQMVYLLSEPCKIEDPSWIKPGKVAWDWWNYNNIYGVDFEAGINTETYKYYIDFAAEYGIEYIILDEGWYELGDLMAINPDIDMQELLAYGEEKGVGIILWVVWKTLDDQLEEVMPLFEEWGIAGLKVDFMQRDDQWMVNYYWRIAEEA
ncbi:MAG: glycoside hydrolase family 97 N-terminal domain-containing protein, partial [Bacteroidales bacterium]|nr:glycoside hydrolase family 97 N-terminal domain-containing protein [Bacteroidales bacterium]